MLPLFSKFPGADSLHLVKQTAKMIGIAHTYRRLKRSTQSGSATPSATTPQCTRMESPPSPPNPTTPSPWRRTRHWKWIIWWHHPGCCITRRYPDRFTASIRAPDKDGVRIAELNEESFRYLLWDHKPLTDFWQTGPGTVRRLKSLGIHTMGELARFSLTRQDMLYDRFGVDAEILIDHAWGLSPARCRRSKHTGLLLPASAKERFSRSLTPTPRRESSSRRWRKIYQTSFLARNCPLMGLC